MTGAAPRLRPVLVVSTAIPLLLIAAVVAGWVLGLRLFVVQSPSMGTAAPVGSLVVDAALGDRAPRVGEIVTYRPQADAAPITHRVIAVGPGGIRTRGDINGVSDAWTTPLDRVIGRSVAVLPGVGWVFRAVPLLVGGLLPVLILSRFLRSPVHRAAARMLGVSVVVAAVIAWFRPLLNAAVLTTGAAGGGVEAKVVSTGLLPIRVSVGDVSAHLSAGQVGTLVLPTTPDGHYRLATALDVGPLGWALLAAVCAAPLLWTLAAGPARTARDAAS